MAVQNKIRIGFELDTTSLKSELKKAYKDLETYQKDLKELTNEKLQIEVDIKQFDTLKKDAYEAREEFKKAKEIVDSMTASGAHGISLLNAQDNLANARAKVDDYKAKIKEILPTYQEQKAKLEEINKAIEQNKTSQENLNEDIEEMNDKLDDVQGLKNVDASIKNIGKSVNNITKKIAGWALAVFGVRGAINLLRNSMSVISQYDDQLAADIEYMKNAIAFALEPVIREIVNLMKQLMFYVAYIINEWTGINIFENANKSLEKSNKQAKKLQKTLAGFDEMNILQDNSSSGGETAPSFDLSSPENIEPPSWLTWIVENKDGILSLLGGIAGFLVAIHLGLGGIQALGIGGIIAGVILLIEKLIKYFNKLDGSLENNGTSWEDFSGILKGVSLILLGVGILTGNVYLAIAGLILLLVSTIMENWTDIKNWWNNDVQPKIDEKLNWIRDKFGWLGEVIYGTVTAIKEWIVDRFTGMFLPIKNVFDGILLFIKGDWQNGLKEVIKGLLNFVIGKLNILIDALNLFLTPLRATIVTISKVTGKAITMDTLKIPRIPYMAKGGIVNMPGRGVPIGGAIAGERGREGVLPLEDKEQMALLGEAIGKYITINANITNTMNGRIISRELQKVNNTTDFAYNR